MQVPAPQLRISIQRLGQWQALLQAVGQDHGVQKSEIGSLAQLGTCSVRGIAHHHATVGVVGGHDHVVVARPGQVVQGCDLVQQAFAAGMQGEHLALERVQPGLTPCPVLVGAQAPEHADHMALATGGEAGRHDAQHLARPAVPLPQRGAVLLLRIAQDRPHRAPGVETIAASQAGLAPQRRARAIGDDDQVVAGLQRRQVACFMAGDEVDAASLGPAPQGVEQHAPV
jgi:hypothetical protein